MVHEGSIPDLRHGVGDATGARSGPLAKMRGTTAHILRTVRSARLLFLQYGSSGVSEGRAGGCVGKSGSVAL